MSNPTEMGIRIRDVRRERGWTQDQLANAVGVSRSAVAQWETGRSGQVGSTLTRLAEVLGVSPDYLLLGSSASDRAPLLTGDEMALVRLYRLCSPAYRAYIVKSAKLLARHD